jgi:hypothetical protein
MLKAVKFAVGALVGTQLLAALVAHVALYLYTGKVGVPWRNGEMLTLSEAETELAALSRHLEG